eukprot:UN03534
MITIMIMIMKTDPDVLREREQQRKAQLAQLRQILNTTHDNGEYDDSTNNNNNITKSTKTQQNILTSYKLPLHTVSTNNGLSSSSSNLFSSSNKRGSQLGLNHPSIILLPRYHKPVNTQFTARIATIRVSLLRLSDPTVINGNKGFGFSNNNIGNNNANNGGRSKELFLSTLLGYAGQDEGFAGGRWWCG